MKTLIVYTSQTGFTKRYAEWIAARLHAEMIPVGELKKRTEESLKEYDTIIYGGWASMGKVVRADQFFTRAKDWKDKRLALFCVGAADTEEPTMQEAMKKVVPEELRSEIKAFYFPGGLNYEKMNLPSRMMMKSFAAMLKGEKAKLYAHSFDRSKEEYIEPIVSWATGAGEEEAVQKGSLVFA